MSLRRTAVFAALVALAVSCRPALRPSVAHRTPSPRAGASAVAPRPPLAAPALHAWTKAEVCAAKAREIEPLPGKVPFTRDEGRCPDSEPMCDRAEDPPTAGDACFVAQSNLRRAEAEIASGARSRSGARGGASTEPLYLKRVDAHLHLRPEERQRLERDGMVVLDRAEAHSYTAAYHDIFQEQLPVFVSADSILHSVFRSSSLLLEDVERHDLAPRLDRMLRALRATLKASAGTLPKELAADLDLYLAVPFALLHGLEEGSTDAAGRAVRATLFGDEAAAFRLVAGVESSELSAVELFGRTRMVDFSQYVPRGHYEASGYNPMDYEPPDATGAAPKLAIGAYFRAMTWLQRLELNLVSRACRSSEPGAVPNPEETPREARLALALADLVERAGVRPDLARFESVYSTYAGSREDVPVEALADLLRREHLRPTEESAPARLRALLGEGYARKARVHYMPELPRGAKLPVITTLVGSRVPPDVPGMANVLEAVKYDRPFGYDLLGAMLGHTRAREQLATKPGAPLGLVDDAHRAMADSRGGDLYARWLSAVLSLGDAPPAGSTLPRFMKSAAYADFRLGSALVAYAQIRHNYVLLSAQAYDSYGCEIPDGFVEPVPELYARLADYARSARSLGALPRGRSARYFERVEKIMRTLEGMARKELRGEPFSDSEKRWLGMVAEYTPRGGYVDSGAPPKYTGWYFDLYSDRNRGAQGGVDFVADLGTSVQNGTVYSVGAEAPRLGVFLVDTGGGPRVFVGPVAKGYERIDRIADRPTDSSSRARAEAHTAGPWTKSYLAAPPPEPALRVEHFGCEDHARVLVQSVAPLGDAELTLLDHHGDAASRTAVFAVGPEGIVLEVRGPSAEGRGDAPAASSGDVFRGLHLRVRDLAVAGLGAGPFDLRSGPSVYHTLNGTTDADGALVGVRRPYANYGDTLTSGGMPHGGDELPPPARVRPGPVPGPAAEGPF